MAHRFKPGDMVSFRSDLEVGKVYGSLEWTSYMDETFFVGKYYTIPEHYGDKELCKENNYRLRNKCGLSLYVSDEMLESNQKVLGGSTNMKYRKGNKVVLRKDLEVGENYGSVIWAETMTELLKLPYLTVSFDFVTGIYSVEETGYAISEEMISHEYEEEDTMDTGFQKGDKVVIRQDLKVGKKYGNVTWLDGMESMKNMLFTSIIQRAEERTYLIDTGWAISEEMISHKYEEQHSESDNETEAEPELFVWYCEDDKYVHVLYCDGTVYTMSKNPDNQDKINKILEGYSDSFLLTLEEAKKSALYLVLKRVEVKKPKMYYIRMGLGNLSYVNYDVEEDQYFLSSKVETKHERTMFTEEEANKIVGTNSILTKEEVG